MLVNVVDDETSVQWKGFVTFFAGNTSIIQIFRFVLVDLMLSVSFECAKLFSTILASALSWKAVKALIFVNAKFFCYNVVSTVWRRAPTSRKLLRRVSTSKASDLREICPSSHQCVYTAGIIFGTSRRKCSKVMLHVYLDTFLGEWFRESCCARVRTRMHRNWLDRSCAEA